MEDDDLIYLELDVDRQTSQISEGKGDIGDLSLTERSSANLSTMIPARIAWATVLNFGLSDGRRLMVDIERVNVIANQSRTSLGTESGSISDRAPSSSSINLLKRKLLSSASSVTATSLMRQREREEKKLTWSHLDAQLRECSPHNSSSAPDLLFAWGYYNAVPQWSFEV